MPADTMLGLGFLGMGVIAVFALAFVISFVLELINTCIGLKIVKIDSEFKEIAKVSLYKSLASAILNMFPMGFILALLAATYINKEFFKTDWKNGFIIELPLIIFGILLGIVLIILMVLGVGYLTLDPSSATVTQLN
ncbi:hypothetical protein [Methanococcus voltae]|uniref:Uncharacterized protein n=1 Tax=Methanococcus voltae (strain ATCC BAA-1334 / A3) TaxID=456320 RepID=D7DTP6_METV3|nr:hypothetical protein [Methanococcus voltae]MCS3901360.1 hypothetical protein [Methanococcus voltae]